jgi:putative addiction module component (TIGR02574 family)
MGPRQSSARKQDLLAELLDLPRDERLEVLQELLDSLEDTQPGSDADIDPNVEAVWMVEIRRRYQEVLEGTAKLTPWDEVRTRLLGG